MNILILDPASPEFNRGSFCYLPYLAFSALKHQGHKVTIMENFIVERMDEIKTSEYDLILCSVWSYPQVDAAMIIQRFCPSEVKFFGYRGLLKEFHLVQWDGMKPENLNTLVKEGIENYFYDFENFRNILLSDCDMHFAKYPGQVYPLFTSYGCPKDCGFCPTSKNCLRKVVWADEAKMSEVLKYAAQRGMTNIHFTDEDFLLDTERARRILQSAKKASSEFKFIAMSSSFSLKKYLEKYGSDEFLDQIKIVEVGFETGDEELLAEMHKKNDFTSIKETFHNDIFWLNLTFFPGETIKSLRASGRFLEKYGSKPEDLYSRVAGNSTPGGLGQFFQIYPDTIPRKEIEGKGLIISDRPMRLIPSFVPYSLLNCNIHCVRRIEKNEEFYYNFYKVKEPDLNAFEAGMTFYDYAQKWENPVDGYVSLAISAKLGVIE